MNRPELGEGSRGADVVELRRLLHSAGFSTGSESLVFDNGLSDTVRGFQRARGIEPDGRCGEEAWAALVEAGFRLGDRLIYLTAPMLRGDDIADLQLHLGTLGFDTGRVDGIFGPMTQSAVREFQQQIGLVCDQVCGPDTVAWLRRLRSQGGSMSVAGVRERVDLAIKGANAPPSRVALAHKGDAELLTSSLAVDLVRDDETVAVLIDDRWSPIASAANDFGAELCIAFSITDEPGCEVEFFAVPGFSSVGGERLAVQIVDELNGLRGLTAARIRGSRSAILRETRAPSVLVRVGDFQRVDAMHNLICSAIHRSITAWSSMPTRRSASS